VEAAMKAHCQCGQVSVMLPDSHPVVVACHCEACQRRSGSPFGVLAYYPAEQLVITGAAKGYLRPAESGGTFETFFCPQCGSTVYAKASRFPDRIGVALGAIADPAFPEPVRSVWEEKMHHWVAMPAAAQHFPRGRTV
jgi:hypothetical protein